MNLYNIDKLIYEVNLEPALNYIFSSLDKDYYYGFKIDIYLSGNLEEIPDNILKILKLCKKYNVLSNPTIYEVNSIQNQKIILYNNNKKINLDYDILKDDYLDIITYIIRNSSYNFSKILMSLFSKSCQLSQVLLDTSYIIEKAMNSKISFDENIKNVLKIITSNKGAGFNRAVLFKKFGDIYRVDKAYGPMNELEYDLFRELELKESDEFFENDFNEVISHLFFLENEINILFNSGLKSKNVFKLPSSYIHDKLIDSLDIIGEVAIMPIQFENRNFGLIIADNRFNYKPITDEQLYILDYIGKQASLIWENKTNLKALKFEAETDALTKLGNRNSYEKYIEKLAISNPKDIGIIMIDIDDFKQMNDSLGHEYGDSVLKNFSTIVRKNIRKSDFAFRYGGDEFIIFLDNIDKKTLNEIINRINNDFKEKCESTFSSGAVIKKNEDIYTSLKKSDELLYISKRNGKGKLTLI